ncbi:MAG: metalloprotease PmbA [Betaproteobacteria bacterium]|nr:metalloprotease PmbA [Betaproteobacteria bacterium]
MKIDSRFTYSDSQLREFAQTVLDHARALGASGCECDVSEGFGLSVTVRKGSIDTLEHNRDKGIGVSVQFGSAPHVKRGHASTSDFSPAALRQTVEAAVAIARHTAADDCAGLPEREQLARDLPDLDLFHPWHVSPEDAIEVAKRCEAAAFALSPKLRNTEGTSLSAQHSQFIFANSLGFMGGFPTSRHSLGCSMIAEEKGQMQRDDWYSSTRVPANMADPEALGRYAGERALARLRARKISTCQAPVLFEAPQAGGLIGHFVSAVSGVSLYRKSTFLLDSLGKPVFSKEISIEERPYEKQAMASSPFDEEGVATRERSIVRKGVVEGYFLGTYSGRKLGMPSTGSSGGNHNLVVKPGTLDFRGMLKKLHRGLLVTELLGHGTNLITGDYSRGAAGYWVENGEIQYPVEEITIAGNLGDMFKSIVAVGSDVLVRGSRSCGSILVGNMTIAGN